MSNKEKYRDKLTKEEFDICWNQGTERAFSGKYWDYFEDGIYHCKSCNKELFDSESKFDSGCGWPSFDKTKNSDVVSEHQDLSFGRVRTEVRCNHCGAHLGHVFDDGPTITGNRYCINSAAVNHQKKS